MGTIGLGPFENDDAFEFLRDLGAAEPDERLDMILGALDTVLYADGFIQGPVMTEAVAAAAAVGISLTPDLGQQEPHAPEWLRSSPLVLDDELVEKSRQLLRRALRSRNNEWWELWDEAGESATVRIALKRSLDRLGDRDD